MSFSRTDAVLCTYHLFVWSNLNSLRISEWINSPPPPCLVLYSFCGNLLHFFIVLLSLSPHDLHLLFCCFLYFLALIWLVPYGVVLCCFYERFCFSHRVSIFVSHVLVFSWYYSFKTHIESILEFKSDDRDSVTFEAYFYRFQNIFEKEWV